MAEKDPYHKEWFKGEFGRCVSRLMWKKRREGKESDDSHFSDENIAWEK